MKPMILSLTLDRMLPGRCEAFSAFRMVCRQRRCDSV